MNYHYHIPRVSMSVDGKRVYVTYCTRLFYWIGDVLRDRENILKYVFSGEEAFAMKEAIHF